MYFLSHSLKVVHESIEKFERESLTVTTVYAEMEKLVTQIETHSKNSLRFETRRGERLK